MCHWFMTTRRKRGRAITIKMMILDVSRAHFRPPEVREIYIDLPAEDYEEGKIGHLLRTLYGTRDAAHQWDNYSGEKIAELDFEIGKSTPCIYRHKSEPCVGWRHGDDLIFCGEPVLLE